MARIGSPHGNVLERSQKFSNILCPYCYRNFCEKAGSRHIEHCREKAKLRYFQKGHAVKNARPDSRGSNAGGDDQSTQRLRKGVYNSVVNKADISSIQTTSVIDNKPVPSGTLSARNNSQRGYYTGLKHPTPTRNSYLNNNLSTKRGAAHASSATCYGLKKPSATTGTQRQERQGGLMNSVSNLYFDTTTSKSKTVKLEYRSKFKKGDGKQRLDL